MRTVMEVYRIILREAQEIRDSKTEDDELNARANGLYRAAMLLEDTAEINPPQKK